MSYKIHTCTINKKKKEKKNEIVQYSFDTNIAWHVYDISNKYSVSKGLKWFPDEKEREKTVSILVDKKLKLKFRINSKATSVAGRRYETKRVP